MAETLRGAKRLAEPEEYEQLAEAIMGTDGQLFSLFDAHLKRSYGTFKEIPEETTRTNRYIPTI